MREPGGLTRACDLIFPRSFLAALDCARGANPDLAVLLSGLIAAVDWIREASAAVIFVSPPLLPLDFDVTPPHTRWKGGSEKQP